MTYDPETWNAAIEAAAKVAGAYAYQYDETEAAHHRHLPQPFDALMYGIDPEVVAWSRSAAAGILALRDRCPVNRP